MITQGKKIIYACTGEGHYGISKYAIDPSIKLWKKIEDLPRADSDMTEVMLQLKLDKNDTVLFGKIHVYKI